MSSYHTGLPDGGERSVLSPREEATAVLRTLALDAEQFYIGGSGALALRDVRRIGDLDLGVTTRYWFQLFATGDWWLVTTSPTDSKRRCDPPILERRVFAGGRWVTVHAFFAWRLRGYADTDYNAIFRDHVELVEGWPCIKLRELLRQKAAIARPKDLADVSTLATLIHLETQQHA